MAIDAWCYTDHHEPARVRALLEGYRAKRRLEAETVEALPAWARWAALRFAVSRLHATLGPALGPERVVAKDWRRYRDRLTALRAPAGGRVPRAARGRGYSPAMIFQAPFSFRNRIWLMSEGRLDTGPPGVTTR